MVLNYCTVCKYVVVALFPNEFISSLVGTLRQTESDAYSTKPYPTGENE